MAKFRTAQSFTSGNATVEVGQHGNAPKFKMTTASGSVLILDVEAANDLADAFDLALDAYESDPLLWEGSA